MKATASQPSALAEAAGYWTIQLVLHAGAKDGHRHVCHAESLTKAKAIASRLCGDTRTSAGFDLYQVGRPSGPSGAAPMLGQSQPVADPKTWAALTALRVA